MDVVELLHGLRGFIRFARDEATAFTAGGPEDWLGNQANVQRGDKILHPFPVITHIHVYEHDIEPM